MAEAKRSIPQIPTIHITTAAHCLAQLRARNAVKHQLRKQGLKVSHYAARDITAMACEYLSEHRSELTPDAIETITRWTLAGEFGKRAQRALFAEITTNAQKPRPPNSTTSTVQMSGAERRRLDTHEYRQTARRSMRSMQLCARLARRKSTQRKSAAQ